MTEEEELIGVGRMFGAGYTAEELMPEKTISEDIRIEKEIAEYEKTKHLKVVK